MSAQRPSRPRPPDLPDYEGPPVNQVSLGLALEPLDKLSVAHIGLLWDKYFREHLGDVEEHPPIEPRIESFEEGFAAVRFSITAMEIPPLPQTRFIDRDRGEALTFQHDWLSRHWRRAQEADEYPHYEYLRDQFWHELTKIEQFLEANKIGRLHVRQCEISYYNEIVQPDTEGLPSPEDFIKSWHPVESEKLPPLERVHLRWSYILSGEEKPYGRLHAELRPARPTVAEQPGYRFDLTARGKPRSQDLSDVFAFFDEGRSRIVWAFTELTTPDMQRAWRRVR